MADAATKAQKIAAAREKLREFQNRQKKKAESNITSSESFSTLPLSTSTNPSMTSSTESSVRAEQGFSISSAASRSSSIDFIEHHADVTTGNLPLVVSSAERPEVNIDISDDSNDGSAEHRDRLPVANYFSGEPAISFFDQLSQVQMPDLKASRPEPFVNIFHADVENGALFHDELVNDNGSDKAVSVSSTLDSSSDYTRKLYSVTAQDSMEQPSQSSDISELERKHEDLISTLVAEQKRCDEISNELAKYKQENESTKEAMRSREAEVSKKIEEAESTIKMQLEALTLLTGEKCSLENQLDVVKNEIKEQNELIKKYESEIAVKEDVEKQLRMLQENYSALSTEISKYQQKIEALEEEKQELVKSSQLKSNHNIELENQLKAAESSISMLEMKLSQVSNEQQVEEEEKRQQSLEESNVLSDKISELQNQVQCLVFERNQMCANYENCLQALHIDLNNVRSKLEEANEENSNLKQKLSMQTDHIAQLEKQLQQIRRLNTPVESQTLEQDKESIQQLKAALENQEQLNKALSNELQEFAVRESRMESTILSLENELERLNTEHTDVEKLQASIESDKIAASQAISQNAKLKKEYESLQDAFIAVTKTNMDLVDKMEQERLFSQRLQKQLQEYATTKTLTSESETNTDSAQCDGRHAEERYENLVNMKAMMQLQERFKDVVNKMADLTEEKHQLEHLVTQLQSETETIGEYVTLYQRQRYLLNQKAKYRDEQVEQMLKEKQQLHEEVKRLTSVIASLPSDVQQAISDQIGVRAEELPAIYERFAATQGEKTDGVLHPTSCYCSGRRLLTI